MMSYVNITLCTHARTHARTHACPMSLPQLVLGQRSATVTTERGRRGGLMHAC
jgi:hypothetical protein